MHMRGTPKTMQNKPAYADILEEVRAFLEERVERAVRAGVSRERIAVDPGIGFGKALEHNLALLQGLAGLVPLSAAVVVGASRKSFLGLLGGAPANDRLAGSLAAALLAYARGARIFRVHDVRATREALTVAEAVHSHGRAQAT
jgi:dihydropteroate synthase